MKNNLRKLREEKGLRVIEVCVQADLSTPTVYALERATTTEELESFNLGTLGTLCRVLKIKPSEAFPGYF